MIKSGIDVYFHIFCAWEHSFMCLLQSYKHFLLTHICTYHIITPHKILLFIIPCPIYSYMAQKIIEVFLSLQIFSHSHFHLLHFFFAPFTWVALLFFLFLSQHSPIPFFLVLYCYILYNVHICLNSSYLTFFFIFFFSLFYCFSNVKRKLFIIWFFFCFCWRASREKRKILYNEYTLAICNICCMCGIISLKIYKKQPRKQTHSMCVCIWLLFLCFSFVFRKQNV